jgi:hypothetical protein
MVAKRGCESLALQVRDLKKSVKRKKIKKTVPVRFPHKTDREI